MKKYNILFISHERKLGGASLSLVALAKQLQQMGHTVYVVVLLRECPLAKELDKNGIKTIPLFFGWWMCPVYWNGFLKFAFKVLYWLEWIAHKYLLYVVKKYEIDIIHSNSSVIDLGAKVAKTTGVKHIWHFREFGMPGLQLDYMKGRAKSVEYINQTTDGVIFISEVLRKYYSDIDCEEKVRVIYNGIGRGYLQKKKFTEKKEIIFVICGNLVENKNQMLVLCASKKLVDEGYHNFRIKVAGISTSLKESQEYEEKLKKYIAENTLEEYVHMLGYVKQMNLVRAEGDVEIVASSTEAFGRVSVEAMMSSMPVIAADAGANPEIVTHGETGYLFKSDSVDELAEAMKKLIEHPEDIKRMGESGYKFAEENFTAEQNARAIEAFYAELVG